MKKIVPPSCDSCGATAQFESDLEVQFCYQCLLSSASFLAKQELLESNPLCELLFNGVWRTTDSTYEVWHYSLMTPGAMSQQWIRKLNVSSS
jgi:hypothetical protein